MASYLSDLNTRILATRESSCQGLVVVVVVMALG
jgi:hypothetical protein